MFLQNRHNVNIMCTLQKDAAPCKNTKLDYIHFEINKMLKSGIFCVRLMYFFGYFLGEKLI